MDLGIATSSRIRPADVLPGLAALPHRLHRLNPERPAAAVTGPVDLVVLDARDDVLRARSLADDIQAAGLDVPVVAVLDDGGLVTLSGRWPVSDFLLQTARPAEIEARLLRAVCANRGAVERRDEIRAAGLELDENSLTVRAGRDTIALTWTEFHLLRVLVSRPGRVFPRSHLIARVWDGNRAPDRTSINVHIARVRRKLGPHARLIRTVRSVGYQLDAEPAAAVRQVS